MQNHGFSSERRLRKPSEFSVVYQGNQSRAKGQYFTVLAFSHFSEAQTESIAPLANEDIAFARLGAVVSKKVDKSAVRRNRIKRLIRESFRLRSHPNSIDFVMIARPGASNVDNAILAKELNYLWKKIHKRCATA